MMTDVKSRRVLKYGAFPEKEQVVFSRFCRRGCEVCLLFHADGKLLNFLPGQRADRSGQLARAADRPCATIECRRMQQRSLPNCKTDEILKRWLLTFSAFTLVASSIW